MKAKICLGAILAALVVPSIVCSSACAQGTAFTYQGVLAANGADANGEFDFTFGLYTNASSGNLIGTLETNLAVAVSNGVFTTTLNFSNAFNGTAYWLGIGVRSNGSTGAFATLNPRQPITSAPYAITASNLTGALAASQLTGQIASSNFSGTFSNSVTFTNAANVFAGNGGGLTNVPGVTSSNWLYAYDTTSQTVNTAGTFQHVNFASASESGWLVAGSGEFIAGQTGVYLVQYQAHFYNGSSTYAYPGMIRAMINETSTPQEITSSEATMYVPPEYIMTISRSFLVELAAGQMLSLQYTGSVAGTGGVYLLYTSLFGQTFPSVTMTVVRIL